MKIKSGIKISLIGTAIEAMGMFLDIVHHLDIGINSKEGLLTPFHFLILVGFLINFVGVIFTRLYFSGQTKWH